MKLHFTVQGVYFERKGQMGQEDLSATVTYDLIEMRKWSHWETEWVILLTDVFLHNLSGFIYMHQWRVFLWAPSSIDAPKA